MSELRLDLKIAAHADSRAKTESRLASTHTTQTHAWSEHSLASFLAHYSMGIIIRLHTSPGLCNYSFAAHITDPTDPPVIATYALLAPNIKISLICNNRECMRPYIVLIKLKNGLILQKGNG